MKLLFTLILIFMSVVPAIAECDSLTDAMSKHQLVIKGMMDMNFKGKLNSENADAIGKRMNTGQEAQNEGDYQKACDIYNSIIKDYGFDESFTSQGKSGSEEAAGTDDNTGSGAEAESHSEAASDAAPAGQ